MLTWNSLIKLVKTPSTFVLSAFAYERSGTCTMRSHTLVLTVLRQPLLFKEHNDHSAGSRHRSGTLCSLSPAPRKKVVTRQDLKDLFPEVQSSRYAVSSTENSWMFPSLQPLRWTNIKGSHTADNQLSWQMTGPPIGNSERSKLLNVGGNFPCRRCRFTTKTL